MKQQTKKIAIIGMGRVGLPLGLYLETLGFAVTGIDKDPGLIASLKSKMMPFIEPGCQELLDASKAEFTNDDREVTKADTIIITVGTPLMSHIETDLSNIQAVLKSISPLFRKGQCLILRSTVAPKTTAFIKNYIERNTSLKIGRDLGLAFCPERLAEHKALSELKQLPQIIGCEDTLSYELAFSLFESFGVKIFRSNYLSAELAKLFNNTARYIDFAVANQFAIVANDFNQNIYEILRLVNEDYPRGHIHSPGFTAGSCLRKDFGMINEISSGPDLLLAAWKVNEYMPYHLVELASKRRDLNQSAIAILGYTFKGNSDDVRDSLVPKLLRYIERHVPRSIAICEPNIKTAEIDKYPNRDLASSLADADVVFIAVNHDAFRDRASILDKIKEGTLVIDIWNCLKGNKISFTKGRDQ